MRTITRQDAIDGIRRAVLKLVDDDHSICQVAAEQGIMCKGFRRFTDDELAQRYDWLVKKKKPESREALEVLANRWQIARQLAEDERLACDVQMRDHDMCDGWDEFSNSRLARYYDELCHEAVEVR